MQTGTTSYIVLSFQAKVDQQHSRGYYYMSSD